MKKNPCLLNKNAHLGDKDFGVVSKHAEPDSQLQPGLFVSPSSKRREQAEEDRSGRNNGRGAGLPMLAQSSVRIWLFNLGERGCTGRVRVTIRVG